MACFADINVSQGSVATYARCVGMFNVHLTANLLRNLLVKNFTNQLRFDRIMVMSLWARFFGPPCTLMGKSFYIITTKPAARCVVVFILITERIFPC